jgi:hypothetical protein
MELLSLQNKAIDVLLVYFNVTDAIHSMKGVFFLIG